jgi:hypothetical protein
MTTLGQRIARATQPSTAKIADAAGRSVLGLAFSDDWRGAIANINEKIDALELRRAELAEQRRGLLLGEDETALSRAENDLAAIDRDLARLRDARDLAAERARRQEEAEAGEAHARAIAEWERGNEELAALAARADALTRETGETVARLAELAERQAKQCPRDLGGHPGDRPLGSGRTLVAAQIQLSVSGVPCGINPPWRDVPTAVSTVTAGIEWARHELARSNAPRKSAA